MNNRKYKHTLGVYYFDLVAYYKIEKIRKIKE